MIPRSWHEGAKVVGAIVVAGILLVFAIVQRGRQEAKARADICEAVHKFDTALVTIVSRQGSRAALSKIGYYREHPIELELAVERTADTVAQLRAVDCTP